MEKVKAGQMLKFKTSDERTANGFEINAKKKTNQYLFVFQEWWGLHDIASGSQKSIIITKGRC